MRYTLGERRNYALVVIRVGDRAGVNLAFVLVLASVVLRGRSAVLGTEHYLILVSVADHAWWVLPGTTWNVSARFPRAWRKHRTLSSDEREQWQTMVG